MAESFDPYHKWLGIPPAEQPPHYYRLLGLNVFESDSDVIRSAADQRTAYVRTFQNGPQGDLSQKILNEISKAKVHLLDSNKKLAYDEALRLLPQYNSRVDSEPESTETDSAPPFEKDHASSTNRQLMMGLYSGIAGLIILGGGAFISLSAFAIWWMFVRDPQPMPVNNQPSTQVAQNTQAANPQLPTNQNLPLTSNDDSASQNNTPTTAPPTNQNSTPQNTLNPDANDKSKGEDENTKSTSDPDQSSSTNSANQTNKPSATSTNNVPANSNPRSTNPRPTPTNRPPTTLSSAHKEYGVNRYRLGIDTDVAEFLRDLEQDRNRNPDKEIEALNASPYKSENVRILVQEFKVAKKLDESAETAVDQKSVVDELLSEADKSEDFSIEKFIASRLIAYEVGVEKFDLQLALQAKEEIRARSVTEFSADFRTLLSKPIQKGASLADFECCFLILRQLIKDAATDGDLNELDALSELLQQVVADSKAKDLRKSVLEYRRKLQDFIQEYREFQTAQETLKQDPTNAAATLTVGTFLAFSLNDWEAAIPLLSKAEDVGLATVAKMEEGAASAQPEAIYHLANSWWALAESSSAKLKSSYQLRAGYWYKKIASEDSVASNRAEIVRRLTTLRSKQIAFANDGELRPHGGQFDSSVNLELIFKGLKVKSPVSCLAISPNNRYLAVGTRTDIVTLYDLYDQTEEMAFDHNSGDPIYCDFYPDMDRLLTTSASIAKVWDLKKKSEIGSLGGNISGLRKIIVGSKAKFLFGVGGSDDVAIWNGSNGTFVARLQGHKSQIFDAAASPDGKLLFTASGDGTIGAWTNEGMQQQLVAATGQLIGIELNFDGSCIASLDQAGTIKLWGGSSLTEFASIATGELFIEEAIFLGKTNWLMVQNGRGRLSVWDLMTREYVEIPELAGVEATKITQSSDGTFLAIATRTNEILLYRICSAGKK